MSCLPESGHDGRNLVQAAPDPTQTLRPGPRQVRFLAGSGQPGSGTHTEKADAKFSHSGSTSPPGHHSHRRALVTDCRMVSGLSCRHWVQGFHFDRYRLVEPTHSTPR